MKNNKSVICFGEILWDNLPAGRRPGGAPMNVAYHLQQLGLNSQLISAVGDDQSGQELLEVVSSFNLSTSLIQVDPQYPTSEVLATINVQNHEVSYEILAPVAWDNIAFKPEFIPILENADAFVFGTLGARNTVSRNTLLQLLDYGKYHVLDINLRAPHYSPEIVDLLLGKTQLLKVNSQELMLIAQWFNNSCTKETDAVEFFFERYAISELIITRGSAGATYYTESYRYDYPAYPIQVADTVGSGDSFLAAFLAMKLGNEPMELTLDYAIAMGAFITSQEGACPPYSRFDLNRFIWKKKLAL